MKQKREMLNNVRAKRIALGFTQVQLAKKIGVSQNSISSIETRQYYPTAHTAALLCEALECKFEDLFELLPF